VPSNGRLPLSASWPLLRNECCFRTVTQQWPFLWLDGSCLAQICHNMYGLLGQYDFHSCMLPCCPVLPAWDKGSSTAKPRSLLRLRFTSLCRRRGSAVEDAFTRFERNSPHICRSEKCFEGKVAGSRDSSVVIATGYGAELLGNPGSIFPAGSGVLYSSQSALTGCGVHPATYPVWEGGISAGVERPWRETTNSIWRWR
jgi:hypothetical protein